MKSGAFKDAVYHSTGKFLTVTFNDGSKWRYHNVKPQTYAAFERSMSKGKYLNTVIRSAHRATRL